MKIRVDIVGYDEWGKFHFESLLVGDKPITTKFAYSSLGWFLPKDFITKIGEWFWN